VRAIVYVRWLSVLEKGAIYLGLNKKHAGPSERVKRRWISSRPKRRRFSQHFLARELKGWRWWREREKKKSVWISCGKLQQILLYRKTTSFETVISILSQVPHILVTTSKSNFSSSNSSYIVQEFDLLDHTTSNSSLMLVRSVNFSIIYFDSHLYC